MIKIIEQSDNNNISYIVQTIQKDIVVNEHEIRCKATTVLRNGMLYYLLFDHNYKMIQSVFSYINIYMDNLRRAPQTKEKTLVALKYLYSYLSIFNIRIDEMTNDDTTKLITFLFGYNQEGGNFTLSFNTIRSSSSVNDYLSLMRMYIKYLNHENHPLLNEGGKKKIITNAYNGVQHEQKDFNIKAKAYRRTQIPKHISLEEFKSMLKIAHNSNNHQIEAIIRLMFESGLRSGEVLSLTFEDLKIFYDEKNQATYKVFLRNRITNKSWQSPKFLMKVKSRQDYKLKSYSVRGFGYEEVMISKSLFELLLTYIENVHSEQREKHRNNWLKYSVTDSVEKDFMEDHNFYIFINSLGKPLSKKTLDNMIKELFVQSGVKIESDGGKYDGLCHRFRHGFAMYQINHNCTPMLLLKELLRHNSLDSTAVYYTPETSTIVKIKDEMSKSLYDFIPEFDLSKEKNSV